MSPGGRLVVHTCPNRWFARLSALHARLTGRNPSNAYGAAHKQVASIVHIDEQSPLSLYRLVGKVFKNYSLDMKRDANLFPRRTFKWRLRESLPLKWFLLNDIFCVARK